MGDILKSVVKELPKNAVSNANFEGANIVLYTEDKEFFISGEDQIRKVVNQIKKRIELRAEQSLLMDETKTKKMIESLIPSEAEIVAPLLTRITTNAIVQDPAGLMISLVYTMVAVSICGAIGGIIGGIFGD